jgi:outer membrane protein assembly factor BamE (lipoprotein component of BamABCDE complex)
MHPKFLKFCLAAGVALALGACASLTPTAPGYERVAQISPGLTQAQVRNIAGKPDNVTRDSSPNGSVLWIYAYTNEWGERSELDVTFDPLGVVTSTFTDTTH